MSRPKERSIITGNRWEAWLSPNRQMVDIVDRTRNRNLGPHMGILPLVRQEDLDDLRRAAAELREALQVGAAPGMLSYGRYRIHMLPDEGNLQDLKEMAWATNLKIEDLAELEELVSELTPMMREFKAPWKD